MQRKAYLKYRPFAICFQHDGNVYEGEVKPIVLTELPGNLPDEFSVSLNGMFRGLFCLSDNGWESTSLKDHNFVQAIGKYIEDWYHP